MTAYPRQSQPEPLDDLSDAIAALGTLSALLTRRPDKVVLDQGDIQGLSVLFDGITSRLEQVYEDFHEERQAARRAAEKEQSARLQKQLADSIREGLATVADNEKGAQVSGGRKAIYPIIDIPDAEGFGQAAVG